jgi:hypothetical protein
LITPRFSLLNRFRPFLGQGFKRFPFCSWSKQPGQRLHRERETKAEQADRKHREDEGAQRIPTAHLEPDRSRQKTV